MLVKEELCDKLVEVRRINDGVMSFAIAFEEEVRMICADAPR